MLQLFGYSANIPRLKGWIGTFSKSYRYDRHVSDEVHLRVSFQFINSDSIRVRMKICGCQWSTAFFSNSAPYAPYSCKQDKMPISFAYNMKSDLQDHLPIWTDMDTHAPCAHAPCTMHHAHTYQKHNGTMRAQWPKQDSYHVSASMRTYARALTCLCGRRHVLTSGRRASTEMWHISQVGRFGCLCGLQKWEKR